MTTAAGDCCADAARADAAGWVLGALDAGDLQRFAGHLLACRHCQRTVADLEAVGALLAATSPAGRAPGGLRAAMLARVRKEAGQR